MKELYDIPIERLKTIVKELEIEASDVLFHKGQWSYVTEELFYAKKILEDRLKDND